MLGSTRLVVRRAASHLGVLLTAMLTAIVVATLLVSAMVLAPGVAEAAFRDSLTGAGDDELTLQASTAFDPDSWTGTDARVGEVTAEQSDLPAEVTAVAWTTSFAVAGLGEHDRVVVGALRDPGDRARLTEGRWPEPGAEPLEVVVHADAFEALGAGVGSSMTIEPLVGAAAPSTVTVVGIFRPDDPAESVWRGYAVGVRPAQGDQVGLAGPVVADLDDLVGRIRPGSTTAAWVIEVDRDALRLDSAGRAAAGMRAVADDLRAVRTGGDNSQMSVSGDVAIVVDRAATAATSVRAVLLVVVTMLTVLGVWALAFIARLLAARRAAATALLRARGASGSDLLRWSAMGALVPVLAVAVSAPLLAQLALSPLRERDVLAGVPTGTTTTVSGWLVAAVAAVCWLVMLVVADLRAGRSVIDVSAEHARPPRRAAIQRAGLDVLVVVLGVLGLQQLRRPVGGAPEVVLVAAPALVVLAGTVLLVRGLPWVGRAASWLAARRPGVPAMLGSFELSRRPLRHVAAASLVVLALAVSVFAAATQATWTTFRADAVDVAHPSDVRVVADFTAAPPEDLGRQAAELEAALGRLPGVEAVVPVLRGEEVVDESVVDVVAVDTDVAGRVMRWDERLAGDPVAPLLAMLADPAAVPALVTPAYADLLGLEVDGDTTTSGPTLSVESEQVPLTVVGVVDVVPSAGPLGVLVDQRRVSAAAGGALPTEYWLATSDDGRAAATAALDLGGVVESSTHAEAADRARAEPGAAGVVAGLTAGLAFAAVFVLIGVVVHAVTSFRSRTSEHAVLRAVGLSGAGSVGTVVVEQGLLLGFAAVAGLGLGLVVTWLVVPHTVGGLAGLPEVPPLYLTVPWPVLGGLAAAIGLLLVTVVGVSATGMRRVDVAAVLRAGEDT
ncbi:MAG TPA: ABC transporter permease [Jiangellaceae bacterium]|nr:ABC transporter permease [Jiangellaceae bacterium]